MTHLNVDRLVSSGRGGKMKWREKKETLNIRQSTGVYKYETQSMSK